MTTDETDAAPALLAFDRDLDQLCEAWVIWCRENGLYWPMSAPSAVLARLGGSTRPLRTDLVDCMPVTSLSAFHVAYTCQPDALDKQVFELYYVTRARPIKVAAAAVGIGRAQFYRVLEDFRARGHRSARALERRAIDQQESATGYSLQQLSLHTSPGDVNT